MGSIRGHYEWDDDDLTPGRKKEGGLHQNLFDSDGNLKGSARFVPDDGVEHEPLVVTETVFITVEERRRTEADEQFEEAVRELLKLAIGYGIGKAKPHVSRWLRESAQPAIEAQRAKVVARRRRRQLRRAGEAVALEIPDEAVAEPLQEVAEAADENRPDMSLAEAQARYLAAIAAKAYSEEQLRLVNGANIVNGDGMAELKRSLAEIPTEHVVGVIETMAANPSLLSDEALAQLASILGREALVRPQVLLPGKSAPVAARPLRLRGDRR
ncbi:hypothetical protein [Knoellia aerolata]|uniref:Uncharacterized protein n=1 Tax=Knoellia aerolata DSM 18566 TaxID=1385519 RepID=A0A0A0JUK2_9MICO|nr:hypothetical protein [Knoellia aerolata]KGN40833.1 hypothetical protein N801_10980 [Knoellia aerolata DSM 18566]